MFVQSEKFVEAHGGRIGDIEAIRIGPGSAWPYSNRAWIWATCQSAKYRDGTKAIESAAQACALGDWKVADHVGTLAAAYAESGDFANTVEYQEKPNGLFTDAVRRKAGDERLRLYGDKKPYREE